ncbi:MAG: bifunctional 5,10-methylenetetrahydrofolate dehydrogenase/5,10-methenyltetrahydrofolate cyclohydrolase [bacterium]|nr:bifunctional 5,10-methylenetetrahydrofolate dehydrogenase/5,10-methenyltetrahydrofolate cyclohydrolase [bacterium]
MSEILDGKKLSEKVLAGVKKEIQNRKLKLKLAVVFVGDDKVSGVYLRKKQEACGKAGIGFQIFGFPEGTNESELRQGIEKIICDPSNSGIVIQLPLPLNRLIVQSLLNLIPIERDPDCLSQKSFEAFCEKKNQILPPVVSAIAKFIKEYKISVKGKNAVVVGRGRLVGLPVSIWLKQQGVKVIVCDSKTKNIAGEIKKTDIVISGAGKPNLIKGVMIKKGAVVIDCGTSTEGGRTHGDVDFENVSQKAGYISPVPGGVGPLAVACLLENLLKLKR